MTLPHNDKIAGKILDCFDQEGIFINSRVWDFLSYTRGESQVFSVFCIYTAFAARKLDNKKA